MRVWQTVQDTLKWLGLYNILTNIEVKKNKKYKLNNSLNMQLEIISKNEKYANINKCFKISFL